MNNGYEAFCMADPVFYDNPGNAPSDDVYVATRRDAPHLWQRVEQGNWVVISPEEHDLPTQGWKIHVSGCLDNAERIIETFQLRRIDAPSSTTCAACAFPAAN